MRIDAKDTIGFVLLAGAFATLALHSGDEHQDKHLPLVANAGGSATSAASSAATVFVNFDVVPMTGAGVQRNQVVIVRDGFITRIGPVGVIAVPEDARVVDGEGSHFLVPGLVDAHVHLPDAREDFLPLFLANGVTTVFNLEGDERHLALRQRSRSPDFRGPTVYTSGPFVDDAAVLAAGGVDRLVGAQEVAGFDFIKIRGDLGEQTYADLMKAARTRGMAVVGHAPRTLPFSAVTANGQAGIVHAEELIYTALLSLDAESSGEVGAAMAAAGTWLTPSVSTFQSSTEQWASPAGLTARLERRETRYLPRDIRRDWESSGVYSRRPAHERQRIEDMNAFHAPLIAALDAQGVRMLTGTDTPLPGLVPGFSIHDELDALLEAGLSSDVVLAAATANAGEFIRERVDATARFGTIEPGARADIITVFADPTLDPRVLRDPLGVMARGVWYDRVELLRMLARAAGERVAEDPS